MTQLMRMARFCQFTLIEYMRSARIFLELLATVAVFVIFLSRYSFRPDYFFSTVGIFLIVLAFYTTSTMTHLGNRPQGYVVLARSLGRGGYLMGLFLAAFVIALALYLLLSASVVVVGTALDMTIRDWLVGSVPLLLNIALVIALGILVSPLVLSVRWRLFTMLLIALAFSGNVLSGTVLAYVTNEAPGLLRLLSIVRTIFGLPLLPIFNGFTLAVTRNYGGVNPIILLQQICLMLGLLLLAHYAFSRRDIILKGS